METYPVTPLREHPEWVGQAAAWFHQKWGIPEEVYRESMQACVQNSAPVPQWYVVLADGGIVAGIGVIANDFHSRKDLTPNVCAVYVEEAYRNRGIAGELLRFVCQDFAAMGVRTLYLLTDHTAFYERYGWEFLCMVQGDGEEEPSRMYWHSTENRQQDC